MHAMSKIQFALVCFLLVFVCLMLLFTVLLLSFFLSFNIVLHCFPREKGEDEGAHQFCCAASGCSSPSSRWAEVWLHNDSLTDLPVTSPSQFMLPNGDLTVYHKTKNLRFLKKHATFSALSLIYSSRSVICLNFKQSCFLLSVFFIVFFMHQHLLITGLIRSYVEST